MNSLKFLGKVLDISLNMAETAISLTNISPLILERRYHDKTLKHLFEKKIEPFRYDTDKRSSLDDLLHRLREVEVNSKDPIMYYVFSSPCYDLLEDIFFTAKTKEGIFIKIYDYVQKHNIEAFTYETSPWFYLKDYIDSEDTRSQFNSAVLRFLHAHGNFHNKITIL